MSNYSEGFNEGKEAGKAEGQALANVFNKLSKEAAILYREKLEMQLSMLEVDGMYRTEHVHEIAEGLMELAFNCGAMAMFKNQRENIQHIDDLKQVVTDFANRSTR